MQELDAAARKQLSFHERNWSRSGIDHMSAMKVIDRDKGGKMLLFSHFVGISRSRIRYESMELFTWAP
jgi:hypothetical protein